MTAFARYIGIDYSGAQTPGDSLAGLRIFEAMHDGPPSEVPPIGCSGYGGNGGGHNYHAPTGVRLRRHAV